MADRGVLIKNNDKLAYQKLIIDQIEKSFNVSLASQFNYSLTKNRIKMMTRINSGKLAKFKLLLVIPLVAILLMAFSIDISNETKIEKSTTSFQVKSNNIPSIFPVKKVDGLRISSSYGMRIHPFSLQTLPGVIPGPLATIGTRIPPCQTHHLPP